MSTNHSKLDALARSFAGPFAFCGIAWAHHGDRHLVAHAAPGVHATADSLFRAASISKIVTGQTYLIAAKASGLANPLDINASDLLGFDCSHPIGNTPIRMGQLLAHTAGLDDVIVPSDMSLPIWFAHSRPFLSTAPGTYFSYSNTGYVLIATAIEALTKTSFAQAAQELFLTPKGLAGGFNWIGVPAQARATALPTFRKSPAGFIPQVDHDLPPTGLVISSGASMAEPPASVAAYAPQGGLRLSLRSMLDLASTLPTLDARAIWSCEDTRGETLGGVFESYGAGIQIFKSPAFYPRPLIGHFGSAYGFKGAVWHDPVAELSFAYALNGLDEGDESDAFSPAELKILDIIGAPA